MFQRGCVRSQPKILISSVSEDRSTTSPPFRPAAARSWSSEDFLVDSTHTEDVSSSVVEEPEETASLVLINSTCNSPQLSYTHSLTSSSVPESVNTESVIDDSAISSPDSWVESEFGVTPEKLCESRSDSSLCDSGTAWEVYRATPVEITTLDEGFVPLMEDRAPDQQSITETYVDEGIYSLSSLEGNQERIQGHSVKKQEVVREKEANLENQNKKLEQVLDLSKAEVTEDIDSKQTDTIPLQKSEAPRNQGPSLELCDEEELPNIGTEELLKPKKPDRSQLISDRELPSTDHQQTNVEESTLGAPECLEKAADSTGDAKTHEGQIIRTESQNEPNNSEEVEVETECQKIDSTSEETIGKTREELRILKKTDEMVVETQNKASEEVLRECLDPQESVSSESCDALADKNPTNQEKSSKTTLDPSKGINVPLISISSEPDEKNEERTCEPERQDHAEDDKVHQAETTEGKGIDTDVSSPPHPDGSSCVSSDDKNPFQIPACTVSENVKTTADEQERDKERGHLADANESDLLKSSNADICVTDVTGNREGSKAKQEYESPQHDSQTQKDLISQMSSTDAKSQPVTSDQGTDLTSQLDGHQDKLDHTISNSKTATTQQSKVDLVNSKHNGTAGISCYDEVSVSRDRNLFYIDFDRNSPTDDLVGDPIEPMDLFYPDKEEPMFTEPPDTEMQSWPSVLSVSALQPAPVSEALPDDQPLNLLGEDLSNEVDSVQENDKVNVCSFSSVSLQLHNISLK